MPKKTTIATIAFAVALLLCAWPRPATAMGPAAPAAFSGAGVNNAPVRSVHYVRHRWRQRRYWRWDHRPVWDNPGTCCNRRSGAARNRTTFRPMSGRENGTRRTVAIGVTNADVRDHVGETDAQTRHRGRCRHRHAPGIAAGDERHRNACRLAARPREFLVQKTQIFCGQYGCGRIHYGPRHRGWRWDRWGYHYRPACPTGYYYACRPGPLGYGQCACWPYQPY